MGKDLWSPGCNLAAQYATAGAGDCCAMASTDPSQAVCNGAARLGGAYSVANSISQLVAHTGGHKSFAMENEARTRASNASDS